MLPLFRKIRFKLAKNKSIFQLVTIYIRETVIVVIGILIALQVNRSYNSKIIQNHYGLRP